MKTRHKRYHFHAWGHPILPDINGEFDDEPTNLGEYPFRSVALLSPVSESALRRGILYFEDGPRHPGYEAKKVST